MNYDFEKQKLLKDNGRFDFDKTIYLDLFLKQNQQRSEAHRKDMEDMKKTLKKLKDAYDQYTQKQDVL